MKKHWIKDAIKHPGSLRKELHVKKGEKIPKKKLEKAAHHKGKEGKRAKLAMTLEGLHKHSMKKMPHSKMGKSCKGCCKHG